MARGLCRREACRSDWLGPAVRVNVICSCCGGIWGTERSGWKSWGPHRCSSQHAACLAAAWTGLMLPLANRCHCAEWQHLGGPEPLGNNWAGNNNAGTSERRNPCWLKVRPFCIAKRGRRAGWRCPTKPTASHHLYPSRKWPLGKENKETFTRRREMGKKTGHDFTRLGPLKSSFQLALEETRPANGRGIRKEAVEQQTRGPTLAKLHCYTGLLSKCTSAKF